MARSIAYRRAQQNRMISKAMKIVRAEDWFWRKRVGDVWVTVKVYDPRTEAKKRANNLAACSYWPDDKAVSQLKQDASARQQLEEVI